MKKDDLAISMRDKILVIIENEVDRIFQKSTKAAGGISQDDLEKLGSLIKMMAGNGFFGKEEPKNSQVPPDIAQLIELARKNGKKEDQQ